MICQFCGKQVDDNDRICRFCGSALSAQTHPGHTEYINSAGDTEKVHRERHADMDRTERIPTVKDGFENSRRVRDEVGRHGSMPQKKQYYRYNPNDKTTVKGKRTGSSGQRQREELRAPKRRKHRIGRTVLRIVVIAIVGFILGFAAYAISVNVSNKIDELKNPSAGTVPVSTKSPSEKSGSADKTKGDTVTADKADKNSSETKETEEPKSPKAADDNTGNKPAAAPKTEDNNPKNDESGKTHSSEQEPEAQSSEKSEKSEEPKTHEGSESSNTSSGADSTESSESKGSDADPLDD